MALLDKSFRNFIINNRDEVNAILNEGKVENNEPAPEEEKIEETSEATEDKVEETTTEPTDESVQETNEVTNEESEEPVEETTEAVPMDEENSIAIEDIVTNAKLEEKLNPLMAKIEALLKENEDLKEQNAGLKEQNSKFMDGDFGNETKKGVQENNSSSYEDFDTYSRQFMK